MRTASGGLLLLLLALAASPPALAQQVVAGEKRTASAAFDGAHFLPPYLDYYQFQSELSQIARISGHHSLDKAGFETLAY